MFLNLLCPSLEYISHVAVTVAHAEEEGAILRNTPPPPQLLWISGITELYVLGEMGSLEPLYHGCFPQGGSKITDQRHLHSYIMCVYIYVYVCMYVCIYNKFVKVVLNCHEHVTIFTLHTTPNN